MNNYEISVWQDYQVYKYLDLSNNSIIESEHILNDGYQLQESYFDERKTYIIGSNLMNTDNRAFNSQLTRSTNGEYSLTFTLYSPYFDNESREYTNNPFVSILTNEQKIKLFYKDKWYDFVIKTIEENSDEKSFNYTAKALYINELSKNGIELTFDDELENNTGTIIELGKKVVEGTDWQIDNNSDTITQTILEPLYELITSQDILATNQFSEESITISANSTIYIFYSVLNNKESYCQFLYREDGYYTIDDEDAITNSENWVINGTIYTEAGLPTFVQPQTLKISEVYKGRRFVRQAVSLYDSRVDRIVNKYTDSEDNIVFGYSDNEYLSPDLVLNLLTNGDSFTSTTGWTREGTDLIYADFFPRLVDTQGKDLTGADLITELANSKLTLRTAAQLNSLICNSGLIDNRRKFLNIGIAKDEQYVVRFKAYFDQNQQQGISDPTLFSCFIAPYDNLTNNKFSNIGSHLFDFSFNASNYDSESNYVIGTASAQYALTYEDLLNKKIGFFIQPKKEGTLVIESIEFFKYYLVDGKTLVPGYVSDDLIKTQYSFYKDSENQTAKNLDEVKFLYRGSSIPSYLTPVYNESCEKIRSIKVSKSNRFNILQELSETFECWPFFSVDHDSTGKIIKGTKKITFKNYHGKDNFAGFKKGINLKNINRNIDSDQIVTKIVVEANSNDYATDQSCSIARAIDNPTGEQFFYDFRHYYNSGLLDKSILLNDLYLYSPDLPWIGYYTRLKQLNNTREEYIQELSLISTSLIDLKAQYATAELIYNEAQEEISNQLTEFANYPVTAKYTYKDFISTSIKPEVENIIKNDPEVVKMITSIETLKKQAVIYLQQMELFKDSITAAQERIDTIQTELDDNKKAKVELNAQFYKKYYRFIQEGSWISEDYVDDNLYFYDAASTLAQTAVPQISYNISVTDVSSIEDFENYNFEIGDKTTIEDTEFFGYSLINGVKTPIQEEIIISAMVDVLDSPIDNSITVQNYKTKFEDLFQRVTTTATKMEYQSGRYNRSSNILTPSGDIKSEVLQDTFDKNSFVISNAEDQTVLWDSQGITVTSPKSPNQLVRIINGGIYISTDGGLSWQSAITGVGVNANYINSGYIDTSNVRIFNGEYPTFKWDSKGITAYSYITTDGQISSVNYNKYVRYDQYGLYGALASEDWYPENLEDLINNTIFALSWDGFSLKSAQSKGYVQLSSTKDFVVNDGFVDRIRIGNFGTYSEPIYGISIRDTDGNPIFETDNNGKLWLKKQLSIGSTEDRYNIQLGYLEGTKTDGAHETFNVNNNFIVYEDGTVKATQGEFTGKVIATSGEFTGAIYATSGKIGNMTIQAIEEIGEQSKTITITGTDNGVIKVDSIGNMIPSEVTTKLIFNGYSADESTAFIVSWYVSTDSLNWTKKDIDDDTQPIKEIVLRASELAKYSEQEKIYIKAELRLEESGDIIKTLLYTYTLVRDGAAGQPGADGTPGQDGESVYYVKIVSDSGEFFKNLVDPKNIVLQCYVYKGNTEIIPISYQWYKNGEVLNGATNSFLEVVVTKDLAVDKYSCQVEI